VFTHVCTFGEFTTLACFVLAPFGALECFAFFSSQNGVGEKIESFGVTARTAGN